MSQQAVLLLTHRFSFNSYASLHNRMLLMMMLLKDWLGYSRCTMTTTVLTQLLMSQSNQHHSAK
jgi:hypothetical protein